MSEDSLVARAARIDTATLSDALDRLGIPGQCLGIKPLAAGQELCGRAFTVRYAPAEPGGTVGDFVDDVPPGAVIVIDNAGREDATVWGDIMTLVASRVGLAGTVIDGACRDTHLARSLGYAMFSRSYSMRTGKDRVQMDAVQVPVSVGGSRVRPGDIMRGDGDGVIAVPAERADEVLVVAETIDVAEQAIREAVTGGSSLREAREAVKYHLLQRKAQG